MSRKIGIKKSTIASVDAHYKTKSAEGLASFKRRKLTPIEAGVKTAITGQEIPEHYIERGDTYTSNAAKQVDEKATWEELDILFNTIANGFMSIAKAVQESVTNKEVFEYVDNKELAVTLVKSFFNDADYFSSQLADVKAKHQGKKGIVSSAEENNEFLSISFLYDKLSTDWMALTSTTVIDIVDMLGTAEQKYVESKKIEDAELIEPDQLKELATQPTEDISNDA